VTRSATQRVTLGIDSFESSVRGAQEQSAYNGHVESVCYHPLFVFNPDADCVAAKLRAGNVHSAPGGMKWSSPVIERYCEQGQSVVGARTRCLRCPPVRGNAERFRIAGLAAPAVCSEACEKAGLSRADVLIAIQAKDAEALRKARPESA